jgi:hypothetical protein
MQGRAGDSPGGGFHDLADGNAIGKHVIVVIVPLAGGPACRGAFQK